MVPKTEKVAVSWREKGLGERREEEKEGESEKEERREAGAQRATVELDKNPPRERATTKEFTRSRPKRSVRVWQQTWSLRSITKLARLEESRYSEKGGAYAQMGL
jgi:hypothetical protein